MAHSFGDDGVDRHIMIFKREYAPSDDKLNALRRGEEWNDEIAKRVQEERERKAKDDEEAFKSRKRKNDFIPNSNYKDKYVHLIGTESALEGARKTEANNSSYGCGEYNLSIIISPTRMTKKKKKQIINLYKFCFSNK